MIRSGHGCCRFALPTSLAAVALASGPALASQDTSDTTDTPASVSASDTNSSADALSEVVVTGSRFGGRIITQSPTPVDLITSDELAQGGRTQVQSMLKAVVPSFNTPSPSASGVGDFTKPPSLRGLSPGDLLVLVNGKRRHTSSDLNNSNGIGRGDIAYDFNAIPSAALASVEVLRDGAAAQYGSDAIAGVIDLVLNKAIGADVHGSYGGTTKGDGHAADVSGAIGLPLGENGVIRTTVQYQNHGKTNRALADTRQQYFGSGGTKPISALYGSGIGLTPSNGTLDPREATFDRNVFVQGEQPFTNKAVFMNMEAPTTHDATFYAFGGYNRLDGTTYNFFRRAGQNETVRALYPNGFLPPDTLQLDNLSAAVGVKGNDLAGFNWDLSTVYGGSRIDLRHIHSNNVSMGTASPTTFDAGGNRFYQWTSNLDLTREIPVGSAAPLKLAFGLEYRKETYKLIAGEPASYLDGGIPILDGPAAGQFAPVGSQPSPGNRPQDASAHDRHSKAAYVELEKGFLDRLLLSVAGRHEQYSDFGSTTNYKVASRLKLTEALSLRGSYGTGFRAPALAQSFYSASNTNFLNGNPVLVRIFPVDDPVARLVGASDLKPEKSRNLSLGAVLDVHRLTLSADYYNIKVRDRIAISSNFQDARITSLLAGNGFPGIGAVAYLTNAIDTDTRGVDLTGRYRQELGNAGVLVATLAANFNKTKFDRIAGTPAPLAALGITAPLFDLTQQVRFSDSQPKDKISLNLNWTRDNLSINLINTRYGRVAAVAVTNKTPAQVAALLPGYDVTLVPSSPTGPNSDIIQTFAARILTDLEVSYTFGKHLTLALGADNLFDVYPTRNLASTVAGAAAGTNGSDNAGTLPYNAISPFGFSGRYLFVSAGYKF